MYHSPMWQPDGTKGARLISTRCNNGLPTSPGPLTHMKPVGLALPPLTRLPLTVKPSMRVPSSTWVEPTKIRMGYWLKWAPTSYPPKLVTSISHLTLLVMFIYMCVWLSLIVFQMPLKATTRFLMPPKAPT